MTSSNVVASLEAAKSATDRPKRVRLREYFDSIEAAKASGVPTTVILEILAADGLHLSKIHFHSVMAKIRKERKGHPPAVTREEAQKAKAMPTGVTEPEPKLEGSHDPRDLDAIFSQRVDLVALAKYAKTHKGPK
jgi:hypothetical protein